VDSRVAELTEIANQVENDLQKAQETRKARNHTSYLDRMKDARKRLSRASVPISIINHLEGLNLGPSKGYAFNLVSYLLAESGRDVNAIVVPQGIRMNLAATTNTKLLAERTKVLVENGVIELVGDPYFNPKTGYKLATTFRIHQQLLDLVRDSDDVRRYDSLSAYRNNSKAKAKPVKDLDESFDGLPEGMAELKDVILRLQQRPVRCDEMGLRRYLRDLDNKKQQDWSYVLHGLRDGPNYSRYRLARSGRIQTTRYNLQGVPKPLRQFFYPRSEDYCFLDLDYKMQESWILASLSRDEALIEVLTTGDIYQVAADYIGITRNEAKPVVNAYNYGAWPKTLAREIYQVADHEEVSPEQIEVAEGFKAFMRDKFPVAARWIDDQARQIRESGVAVVESGLTRTGLKGSAARREGVNHLIQGLGAVILWKVLLCLDGDLGDLGEAVLPMHDGLVLEARMDGRDEAFEIARRVLEEVSEEVTGFVIPVDGKFGWSS
jgi:hypothetical protein